MWFDSWSAVLRVVVLSAITYVALSSLIRLYGKRTIAQMNPGDFVVTVAIGSVAGSMIVFAEVPLANGLAALTALLAMQFLAELLTSKSHRIRKVVDGSPTLLVHQGVLLKRNMERENVDEEDVFAAMRQHGIAELKDVATVVLEIGGGFSVIPKEKAGTDALQDVQTDV